MRTTLIDRRGKVAVPAAVRRFLELKEGDKIEWIERRPGLYEIRAVRQVPGPASEIAKQAL